MTNLKAAPAPVKRGFGPLPCPRCLAGAVISLDLDDLEQCRCGDCEETFSLSDIRDLMAQWAPVLAWLESAPARKE